MALQLSTTVRNSRLDAIETAIGLSPILKIWSGSMPGNCAASDTGTQLVHMTLPSDWMASASSGSKSKSGTWEEVSADAAGTAGYFRIYDSGGVNCHIQGTVTAGGGGGDMTIDNTTIAIGQDVVVTAFTLNDANA